ncbi:MAG: hypothetical protein VKP70_10575 [Cyanobacteriota bacterium]|nr:hypothetical protein [Cyanobacteriota bacterium]
MVSRGGWCRADDAVNCRQLRQQRAALATAAMEKEIAQVRAIRGRLCPNLAAKAEVANARDGQYGPMDYGAWAHCRLRAEQALAASHSVLFRNGHGMAYYTREGADLARQAEDMGAALRANSCP